MSKKASLDHKQLRAIGHKLKPVVTVAGNGLSDTVLQEALRALGDHELIKVKIAVGDRDTRRAVTEALCTQTGATLVQSIGNVVLLLKRARQPDPRLSNLMRVLD
ncbi:MAG: ribosome assembly RNA-binding protein YhbY [Haliea sp.]|uniref:YhbY family RNA-binding protein n=1 Tax=Haliea sp. TaxID=1932666 RepID=UPI000C690E3C|nr:YhbY family RNA-binding protein [Haliea sp.]MBM68010.1 ribosome assembly RNA-binding protein YhbY [Haliea sp.]|tara:strand:+ start:4016 stop:4330 length:315 start_codon:yes stop_codon:yes gene_type:complete